MPGKSKSADTATIVSDDAIRQRADFLWEADGRPDGRGDHYWHLAHEEATRAPAAETGTRTGKATKGKNPSEPPAEGKAGQKASKSKVKVKVAEEATKPKKNPKPRAAVQKSL
jgi:hypothetical protein